MSGGKPTVKRLFRSLRLHILLPTLIMMLLLAVLITVVVSRTYIEMSLRQESDKNVALFDAIGRQIDRTVAGSIADARHITNDERIIAYVILSGDRDVTSSDLRRYAGRYLPGYMVPTVKIVKEIPLDGNGKTDVRALIHHCHEGKDN